VDIGGPHLATADEATETEGEEESSMSRAKAEGHARVAVDRKTAMRFDRFVTKVGSEKRAATMLGCGDTVLGNAITQGTMKRETLARMVARLNDIERAVAVDIARDIAQAMGGAE
jgi:hypothetical protein